MKRTNTATWLEKYNRWQIKVQKDGQRRTFTCSTPGRTGQRKCHAKADAWLDDNIADSNARVNSLFADYLKTLQETTSKSNWVKIQSFGKNWILPAIGTRKICDVTEQHLQSIINKGYAKGLSKKTLTNLKATITSFFKYCRKRKATTLLPEDISIPKGACSAHKQILQPEYLYKLFHSDITTWRGKPIVDPLIYAYRFQVLTGLRPGELLGLRWKDIRGNEVFVSQSINVYNEITTGKNENAIRHFFMSETATVVLQHQRQISHTERIFGDTDPQKYRKSWQRYCRANDIPQITPYEMRHTFVSIAKNLSEGQIKPIVGHSQNMDTFGTYGHEVNGELQKTAQQLNALFLEILEG
ncbi:tyrosine-type recombinase/integrase [Intestinibacillus massiliensis]|uniref:tyrosine-type recombinase/integrase n=1 Tax=Intestinibacillus massiliensis TaxID=1871029 RepID=UPI0013566204|nr:tyrosine-type recombinase/integrase [Intestinibacillus massiliensis]